MLAESQVDVAQVAVRLTLPAGVPDVLQDGELLKYIPHLDSFPCMIGNLLIILAYFGSIQLNYLIFFS